MASLRYKGLPQQGAGTDPGGAQTNGLSKFGKLSPGGWKRKAERGWFAVDSLLEESGFELMVPLQC
jgi:hypothetical protein